MRHILNFFSVSLLVCVVTATGFAQEKVELAKVVKSDEKASKDAKKETFSADKEKADPAPQTTTESKCESCRWFEPTVATFSIRYRTTTDSGNVRNLNQAQQRIVLGAKFKFDKAGKYTINAQSSSGYYFNWAYAEFGVGAGGDESIHRAAPFMTPWIVRDNAPGAINQAVSGYIAANFPNATPAQIAQLRPVLTAQFTPIVTQAVTNATMLSLTTYKGAPKGWNIYLRQLYFQAKPVKGLELSYGSMPLNRGVNSEATSYDNDGYVSGGRVTLKRPDKVWFDEMSATYAYLGDLYTPNFFRRTKRFSQSNYHQFLLRKKLANSRVDASVDYTFQDGTDTMREGVLINTKETKVFDTIRVEAYQRIGSNNVSDRVFKGGNGFYVEGEKTIAKKLNLSGGYASIDRNYTVYSEYGYKGLDYYGFALNGDQTGVGKRFIAKANYKLTKDVSISMLYSQAVGNDFEESRYFWNKTHFNVALTYDILQGVKRLGWFK
jgi:hypothetical protein